MIISYIVRIFTDTGDTTFNHHTSSTSVRTTSCSVNHEELEVAGCFAVHMLHRSGFPRHGQQQSLHVQARVSPSPSEQ
jgi:hypothetical protein